MDVSKLQQLKQRYRVVGNCEQLNHALDVCLQVASTDLSVLIIGESGVGKEVLPRIIHDNSMRRRGPYFAINCGSIPEGTIDSELFGHEKGAFTGAIGEHDGYFGAANNGTLFLDEVGELPLSTQARLLRVLETGEYIRVGGQKVMKTDVRIVAATNVNMRKAVSEGRFREDLYYRLNTIPVQMPPLRDRGNDILSLFRLFALDMVEKYKLPRLELTEEAQRLLLKYKWPGNVRQLKNITEQMSLLCEDRRITADELLRFIPDDAESMSMQPLGSQTDSHTYDSERAIIFNFLFELQGNIASLNNEVLELRKQIVALGGTPSVPAVTNVGGIPALPSPGLTTITHQPVVESNVHTDSQMHNSSADVDEYEEITDQVGGSLNIHDNELNAIRKALQRNGGNRKNAADELGISDRTLYRKLRKYNLED